MTLHACLAPRNEDDRSHTNGVEESSTLFYDYRVPVLPLTLNDAIILYGAVHEITRERLFGSIRRRASTCAERSASRRTDGTSPLETTQNGTSPVEMAECALSLFVLEHSFSQSPRLDCILLYNNCRASDVGNM